MSPRSARPAALRRAVAPQFATPVTMSDDPPPMTLAQEPPLADETDVAKGGTIAFPARYHVMPVGVADIDTLWDWVRADRPGTTGFLGMEHPHSQSFFQHIGETLARERMETAWFRAIQQPDGTLVGFAALLFTEGSGALSLYVTPAKRPDLLAITTAVADALPTDIAIGVVTSDPDLIDAFLANQFQKHIVLTRHRHAAMTGGAPFQSQPLATTR